MASKGQKQDASKNKQPAPKGVVDPAAKARQDEMSAKRLAREKAQRLANQISNSIEARAFWSKYDRMATG